jgi:DNA-binding CsgD family transcriptional regulator
MTSDEFADAMTAILDQMDVCLIITDETFAVRRTNRAGEELLRAGDVFVVRAGRLGLVDPLAEQRFMHHVQHLLGGGARAAESVLPLQGAGGLAKVGITVLRDEDMPGPRLLAIAVTRRAGARIIGLDQLLGIGLTKAEAELCAALLAGVTVTQYAQSKSIAVATARAHLKRAMMRLGVHRQADLIRSLMAMF